MAKGCEEYLRSDIVDNDGYPQAMLTAEDVLSPGKLLPFQVPAAFLTCNRVVFPLPRNPDRRVTGRALTGIGACFFAAADLTFAAPFDFVEVFAFAMMSSG